MKQKEGKRVLEALENKYREKFSKGEDWKEPTPNPFNENDTRISIDSYHGMEVVGISIEKYNDLKKDFDILVTAINQRLQYIDDEFFKKTLQRVGIIPKNKKVT